VKKVISFLAAGYIVFALLLVWVMVRVVGAMREDLWAGYMHQDPPRPTLVPPEMLLAFLIAATLLVVSLVLSYFLLRRRHRKAALVMASGSCLGVPFGTILGVITLFALTRPAVRSTFTT
jgi:hypothetical protein